MKNTHDIWSALREPLLQLGGPSLVWCALAVTMFLFDWASDRWLIQRVQARWPAQAKLLAQATNTALTTAVAGLFAGSTTVEDEFALLGALLGAIVSIVRFLAVEAIKLQAGGGGGLALLLCLALAPIEQGCGSSAAREACYAASRAQFVIDQEQCEDEACIDALLARRKDEQEACP